VGVYRRKDKEGKFYGPHIVQYPHRVDPITGKAVWTTCSVRGSKALARRVYQQKLVEWERKKHLKLEAKKEYTFGELLEWYLDHPKAERKRPICEILKWGRFSGEFWDTTCRELGPPI
jgi:hypothetical protein